MSRLRFRPGGDEVAGFVAVAAFGIGVLLLLVGFGAWWKVMIAGWLLVPIIGALSEMFESPDETGADRDSLDADAAADEDAALDALREQYATGEIPEEEFERRVERLLETESVDDARERVREPEPELDRSR